MYKSYRKPKVSEVIAVLSIVKFSTIIHKVILYIPSTLPPLSSGTLLSLGVELGLQPPVDVDVELLAVIVGAANKEICNATNT